jgi:hypothetical protein
MAKSKWIDQRDIPAAGRYGKIKTPGCECTTLFTCGACLARAHARNMAEREASPYCRDAPTRRKETS